MAKRVKKTEEEARQWREAELINKFNLTRIVTYQTPLMQEWLDVLPPELNVGEQYIFDKTFSKIVQNITGWNEEDLKMKFISPTLELGNMTDDGGVVGYFDKTISATVDDTRLTVKSDFMMAKGLLDVFETPYFHFQVYKPYKDRIGDAMGELLAMLPVAQERNKNEKPLYGVEIMGTNWCFVVMKGREYCISKSLIVTKKDDLLKIIAILRKFRHILETQLMD